MLYRRDLTARMIVEYKAPEIEITGFRPDYPFNMVLKVDYLIVSNGLQHYCCRIDTSTTAIFFWGYTRVSKLIGGATNSTFLLSHHRIIYHARDMQAMMFALSSSVSYESMTKAAM